VLRKVVVGPLVVCALLGGCYVYTPLESVTTSSTVEVALALTDVGRVEAGHTLGPSVDRVEGRVTQVSDTAYVLQVSRVRDIRGVVTKWTGETVTVPRAWVGNAYTRRLSRSRTYVLAGAFTAGTAAFIASRTLGIGGPAMPSGGGNGGGNSQ
jgi:hypothetical protein